MADNVSVIRDIEEFCFYNLQTAAATWNKMDESFLEMSFCRIFYRELS